MTEPQPPAHLPRSRRGLYQIKWDHPEPECVQYVCIDGTQFGDAASWPDPFPAQRIDQEVTW